MAVHQETSAQRSEHDYTIQSNPNRKKKERLELARAQMEADANLPHRFILRSPLNPHQRIEDRKGMVKTYYSNAEKNSTGYIPQSDSNEEIERTLLPLAYHYLNLVSESEHTELQYDAVGITASTYTVDGATIVKPEPQVVVLVKENVTFEQYIKMSTVKNLGKTDLSHSNYSGVLSIEWTLGMPGEFIGWVYPTKQDLETQGYKIELTAV